MKKAYLGFCLALFVLAGAALGQDAPVINEIFYDNVGADAGTFTEVKGPGGMSLDGYALAGVNGNGGVVYNVIDLSGNAIPADGYFVVAQDNTVTEADLIDPSVDWQNGPDQVQLWLITGPGAGADTLLIDSICYGSSGDLVCEGGTNGPDVGDGNSISRCPDGQDTDDNGADTAETAPTPGAENLCLVVEPIEVTLCDLRENDVDGFPVLFGERVHVIDPVTALNDNLIFAGNRMEVYVTDYECCIELFDFNIVDPYTAGTVFDVTGTVDFFNGKTELTDLELTVLGDDGVIPDPVEIETNELATNGEAYDACLVKFCGLRITGGDPWPAEGSDGNVEVDDGSGPTTMRIDRDTEIDGSPAPAEPFTAVGLATQFDSSAPWDSGYQFLPRDLGDIFPGEDCPPPIATQQSTWGQIKSTYRK